MTTTGIAAKLQRLIEQESTKKNTFSVVLGVQTTDGTVDFAGAAGMADAAGTRPMTPETPYYLASISKMYTAAVLVMLAAQSRLKFEDTIATHLPADLIEGIHVYKGTDYSQRLTIAQLISHTSGLGDYFEDAPPGGESLVTALKAGHDQAYTVADYMAITRQLTPKFAPGTPKKAHYSDSNFQLLGAIIESVTGRSVAENFQAMICEPLGLAHTYAYDHTQAASRPEPAPMYFQDRALHAPLTMSSFAPDGGVVATVADSLRFLQAFFEGELFDTRYLGQMMANWNTVFFPIQYGQGLMRFKLPRLMSPFSAPPEFVGHSGSSGSFAFYSPDRQLYIVGTFNQLASPARPYAFMVKAANALK